MYESISKKDGSDCLFCVVLTRLPHTYVLSQVPVPTSTIETETSPTSTNLLSADLRRTNL